MREVCRQTEIAADGELGEDAGGRTVALYGFEKTRKNAAGTLAGRNARVVTIADFIEQGDICTSRLGHVAVTMPSLVEKVRSGKLSRNALALNNGTALTDEELRKWGDFLQKNADKVDIFAKIRSYIAADRRPEHRNATGWVGEAARKGVDAALCSLVAKNISEDYLKSSAKHLLNAKDLKAIVTILETLAEYDGEGDPINEDADFKRLVYECLLSKGIGYGEEEARELVPFIAKAVNNVLGNMLTRQLSKLGLDFFREQNIPVFFNWSTNDGISLENAENEIRDDKWWRKDAISIHDRHDDPIMFSTMRYAMKIQADAGGMPSGITKIKGLGFDPRAGHAAPQGPGAINLDVAKYGAQFRAFVEFASSQRNQDTIARIEGEGHRLQGSDGAPRNIVVKEGDGLKRMSRSQNDKDVNDNVRALFRRTVLAVCGAESVDELPEAVRDAMKTVDHGHGKPLTARRINAVHDAIMSLVQPEEHPELDMAPIMAKKGSKSPGDLADAFCRLHIMVARIGAKTSLCSGVEADADGRNKAFLMAISAIISRMDEDTIRWLREGMCSVKSANIYYTIGDMFDKQEDNKTVKFAFAVASDMHESMMLAMNAALHLGNGDIPPQKNCESLSKADIAQVRQIIRDYAESTEEIRPNE